MSVAHDHAHAHGGGHAHAPADFGRAFAIGIVLNTVFVVIEATYGIVAGSMALLADAGHNLSDVLGLTVAWAGATLAKRPPTERFTYGLRGSTILAALANALLLLVAVGAIGWEAIGRLGDPQPVAARTVMIVAGIGIVINAATALMFARGRHGDINIRGAYLHMAADAAISAGVVVAGLAMLLTGFAWIDAVVSLAIVAMILWSTWGLLRDSLLMLLGAVPANLDSTEIARELALLPGVARVHDLHVWPVSTTETALTTHLVMPDGHGGDAFLAGLRQRMHDRFGIMHCTVQIERDASACALEPQGTL